jgi:hypothetical protein
VHEGERVAVLSAAVVQRRVGSVLLTGSLQAGVQALGFIAGLLVIRLLPVHEYAYYTIANAMLGTLMVLTDCGISHGVMARGGKVWQSRESLAGVMVAGMALRRRFAAVAVLVSLPILFLMLREQGASFGAALLVAASIVPLFLSSLTGQMLEVVPRLHQRLTDLQRIQLSGAGLRLATMASAAALLPYAWLASLAAGLAQTWTAWRVRRLAGDFVNLDVPPDPVARNEILQQVRRMAPGAVYYAFAGQIGVFLISMFGSTESVAQVGALSRLTMVFTIATAVFSLIVVPRFARLQGSHRRDVLRTFWQAQLALGAGLAVVVFWVSVFPDVALSVLGPGYALLKSEVGLAAAGAALALLSGTAYALGAARGVVASPWFVVPFAVTVQVALILSLPMATVAGVLWLGILSNLAFWLTHTIYFTRAAK